MTKLRPWMALLGVAGVLAVSGCAPMQVNRGITINVTNKGYQPPADAPPAPTSMQVGDYDYSSGVLRVNVDGVPTTAVIALNGVVLFNARVVGQVTPMASPTPARLHIVIADHDRLRLLALQNNRGVQSGAVEFGAEYIRIGLHQIADAVVRSQAFSSADIVEQNDTVWPDAAGADYVLWYQVQSVRPNNAGPWVGSWQMRRANGAANLAVTFDPGTAPGPARLVSFINSAREVAGSLSSGGGALSERQPGTVRKGGHPVSKGSGIVIDASGHVLTDNHVIINCGDIRVTDANGGTPVGATLIANNATLDLAVLQTGRRWSRYAQFRDSTTLRPGEPVVATGFPLTGQVVSEEMSVTTGSLNALSGGAGNLNLVQFSAPTQPGDSGGPVLDGSGHVVGIIDSVLNIGRLALQAGFPMPQNVNFATKANVARDYLAPLGLSLDESSGPFGLDAATVAEGARKFTVKVECWK